jgi:hypothetical protein
MMKKLKEQEMSCFSANFNRIKKSNFFKELEAQNLEHKLV